MVGRHAVRRDPDPVCYTHLGVYERQGVYTQPDRPAGRGRGLTASPVKLEAVQRGIPVFQPDNFRSAESKRTLRALKPDLMVVVAYGLLLPQSVLDLSLIHI